MGNSDKEGCPVGEALKEGREGQALRGVPAVPALNGVLNNARGNSTAGDPGWPAH